jgi:hypothetical protein
MWHAGGSTLAPSPSRVFLTNGGRQTIKHEFNPEAARERPSHQGREQRLRDGEVVQNVFHVIDKTSYWILVVGDLDQVDRFLSRFPD